MSDLPKESGVAVIDASNFSERVSVASSAAMQAFDRACNSDDILAAAEVAEYIVTLRDVLEPKMGVLMSLADSPLGFKTDRSPAILAANKRKGKGPTTPYPAAVVKDCILEAHLRGVKIVANQFNIIAAQCYIPKDGYKALINKSGATDFDYKIRKVSEGRGEHVAEGEASWKLKGKPYRLKQHFFCKVYDGFATWELSEGKATRKLFKAVYERISGRAFQDEDEGIKEGAIDVAGEVVEERHSLPAEQTTDDSEAKADELLGLMGGSEIHHEAFLKFLFDEGTIKQEVRSVLELVELDPDLIGIFLRNWSKTVERYKAKVKVEATV